MSKSEKADIPDTNEKKRHNDRESNNTHGSQYMASNPTPGIPDIRERCFE